MCGVFSPPNNQQRDEKMDYKYKFSVIIPVYNVEEYLDESILSLVNQTIGFEKNIQLILVNDGSTDNSADVCKKYKDMYPNNVVYLEQENSGVSVARNLGLTRVEGKYVNFLDSDDFWSKNAFKLIYKFFEEHYDEVDVATTSIYLFEAVSRAHVANYRMEGGTRVADLSTEEESKNVVVQVASSFFKAEAIENLRFVVGLKLGEDALFVNTVIMEKMKVGFVRGTTYYYRKRVAGTSAVQTLNNSRYYYIDRLNDYHLTLIGKSIEKFGRVVPYIQNVVYYDFAWNLSSPAFLWLSEDEMKEFKELSKKVLSYIDDKVIIENPVHPQPLKKITAFQIKYDNMEIAKDFRYKEKALWFGENEFEAFARSKYVCHISFVTIKKDTVTVEGLIENWVYDTTDKKVRLAFRIDGEVQKTNVSKFTHTKLVTCFDEGEKFKKFVCKMKIPKIEEKDGVIKLFPILFLGKRSCRLGMNYQKFLPNCNAFASAYHFFGNYCIQSYRTVMKIQKAETRMQKLSLFAKHEQECQKELRSIKKAPVAALRRRYFKYKALHKNDEKIWLISDRVQNAGDNGEVLFKYLSSIKKEGRGLENVRPIFAISRNAECVERLKSEGEVVFFEDKKYFLYFLLAEKIISSGASEFTANPFGADRKYFTDLFSFKYYYLQHGVACADLSGWLNRFSKNFERIFASSEREKNSFLEAPYYYKPNQIVVTGQTRFDDLYNNPEKLILILPTWRRSIRESYDSNTTSVYFDGFKETEYFKYYNGLINNERLLKAMREKGYKGLFCIHPIHMKQSVDFEENDVFSVNEGYVDYNDVFARSSLMVTDYSSVLFDFAYLRKPVVYTHFDKEEFFAGQIYDEGYFSYENDGFGPVCYDMDSTVDAIIAAIDRDCKNEEMYLERLNSFFAYDDKNNCERAYKAIIGERFEIEDYKKK